MSIDVHDDGDLERGGLEAFDDVVYRYGGTVTCGEDDEEGAESQDHVVEMIPWYVSHGIVCAGSVRTGILDTRSENTKTYRGNGCDYYDWVKAVFEMPGTASATRYP